jgi:hypothetical protein
MIQYAIKHGLTLRNKDTKGTTLDYAPSQYGFSGEANNPLDASKMHSLAFPAQYGKVW